MKNITDDKRKVMNADIDGKLSKCIILKKTFFDEDNYFEELISLQEGRCE
jgi:hypothetical protein